MANREIGVPEDRSPFSCIICLPPFLLFWLLTLDLHPISQTQSFNSLKFTGII